MDPPIINEAPFAVANPSAYSLAEIWPFGAMNGVGGIGLKMGEMGVADVSIADSSSVTEQHQGGNYSLGGRKRRDGNSEEEAGEEDHSSKLLSKGNLNNFNSKRTKMPGSRDVNGGSKSAVEANSEDKPAGPGTKPSEPPKQDYIHVRARRGQATDSHSLAERARREKISERMKILQDLVPGCNKVIGKALVLDEIINYIQSLQHQVEFLSMKLEAVNSRMNSPIEGFSSKDLGAPAFDATGILFGSQPAREYMQGASQSEWLHMQLGNTFDRPT